MQKVAYAAIIIYHEINCGKEILAAASTDASPNSKLILLSFISLVRNLL